MASDFVRSIPFCISTEDLEKLMDQGHKFYYAKDGDCSYCVKFVFDAGVLVRMEERCEVA